MKKVHVIFKTHLDLGFTDFADNIVQLYNTQFIPQAINLAKEVNKNNQKKFIWTTGSWIISNALATMEKEAKEQLRTALQKGDIVVHGLPFTTHSELLDKDIFRYGLDLTKNIQAISGQNIISAKMTDVPGHTKAIIPLLDEYGIKMLHIGVNEGSAVPEVPSAFVWRYQQKEVVVLYQKSYGEVYKNEHIDDILYFAHSADNMGPLTKVELDSLYQKLHNEYPNYRISASTLDNYAQQLLSIKDRLPIIESEIGDSWIHGAATDPYKMGAMKELIMLKDKWLKDKSMSKDSIEYKTLASNLLLLGEHTCGLDTKKFLSDIGLYTKKDFHKMHTIDKPKLKLLQRGLSEKLIVQYYRCKKIYKKGSYSAMEKSWEEQRKYIDKATASLSNYHKQEAAKTLKKLIPQKGFDKELEDTILVDKTINASKYKFIINKYGALSYLAYEYDTIISNNKDSLVDYYSYSSKDYNFWRNNYSRNYNEYWVRADFGRPLLQYSDKSYPNGRFAYLVNSITCKEQEEYIQIVAQLTAKDTLYKLLGAPKEIEILYTLSKPQFGLDVEVIWQKKDISRLPESISLNFPLIADAKGLLFKKLDSYIDPYDIVPFGNRNLSAVEEVLLKINNKNYALKNIHTPLVSIGKVNILKFDNMYKSLSKGLSFNLYNNIWGTNFPLWYGQNAYFKYKLRLQKD